MPRLGSAAHLCGALQSRGAYRGGLGASGSRVTLRLPGTREHAHEMHKKAPPGGGKTGQGLMSDYTVRVSLIDVTRRTSS
ncbi:hypothetical protein ACVW0I_002229 [Bradyrhizobium sp. LM6.11]